MELGFRLRIPAIQASCQLNFAWRNSFQESNKNNNLFAGMLCAKQHVVRQRVTSWFDASGRNELLFFVALVDWSGRSIQFVLAVLNRHLFRIFSLFATVHAFDFREVRMRSAILLSVAILLSNALVQAAEVDDALAAIKAVKREGAGNETAAARWKELVKAGPAAIPSILAAFDGADATAANWFRSAVDAIAENEGKAGRKLSADTLESFVKEAKNDPRARVFAFELLDRTDPDARKRILPVMINDPGAGIRREAIEHAIKAADVSSDNSNEKLRAAFGKLFVAARDVEQVEAIAKKLKAIGAGEPDVIKHLGLITRWEVAGPFDNSGLKGFAAPLPKIEAWKEHATGHDRGLVDLYTATGKTKGVKDKKKDGVYALCRTVIESPTERPAHIRAGTENAIKIYFNGQEMFGREEYHHGQKLDQHVANVTLKKGKNEILLKVLQDEATQEWTVDWHFHCRVCDEIGGAIPMTVVTAPKAIPVAPKPMPMEDKK